MNIKIEQLAKKPFDVKKSGKNLKKTYQFQLDMAKLQDKINQGSAIEEVDREQLSDKEKEALDKKEQGQAIISFQTMIDIQDNAENYLTEILKLSEKQADDLEELEQDDIFEISQYVAMRMTGMTDAEIEKAKTEDNDAGLPVQENK